MKTNIVLFTLLSALTVSALAERKLAPVRDDIPHGGGLDPKMEEPVFAVCSKQGMRVLVSRDDGTTWTQTFLGTDSLEDGGWHGNFAVYGMACTHGVIGVFSGWGAPGVYIASDDGENWSHLNREPAKPGSVWDAAGGNGIFLTSADQWRGMTTVDISTAEPVAHRLKELLDGGKTHHMICGFGDFDSGRFVIVGDNRHVFFSDTKGENWQHAIIPEEAGEKQDVIAFGNGVFLCGYEKHIAHSADGGKTWTVHEHGLKGRGKSWRGLSFVNGEFWLTAKKGSHARKSKDGTTWEDLPESTPGGRFVQSEDGTIINVERGRFDIKRSTDGETWETVYTAPEENVSRDMAFAVFGKVNSPKP